MRKVFKWIWEKYPLFRPIRKVFGLLARAFKKLKNKINNIKRKIKDFVSKGKNLPRDVTRSALKPFDKLDSSIDKNIRKVKINPKNYKRLQSELVFSFFTDGKRGMLLIYDEDFMVYWSKYRQPLHFEEYLTRVRRYAG